MAKSKATPDQSEIELRPDGWERFEKAIDIAAKTPTKHLATTQRKAKERPATKGRMHRAKSRS
jgi:hypothetical protein